MHSRELSFDCILLSINLKKSNKTFLHVHSPPQVTGKLPFSVDVVYQSAGLREAPLVGQLLTDTLGRAEQAFHERFNN